MKEFQCKLCKSLHYHHQYRKYYKHLIIALSVGSITGLSECWCLISNTM